MALQELALSAANAVAPYVIPRLQSSLSKVYICMRNYIVRSKPGAVPWKTTSEANLDEDKGANDSSREGYADLAVSRLEKLVDELKISLLELDKLEPHMRSNILPVQRNSVQSTYVENDIRADFFDLCSDLYNNRHTYPVRLLGTDLKQVDAHGKEFRYLKRQLRRIRTVVVKAFATCYLYEHLIHFHKLELELTTATPDTIPGSETEDISGNFPKGNERKSIAMLYTYYLRAIYALDEIETKFRWSVIQTGELREDVSSYLENSKKENYSLSERAICIEDQLRTKHPLFLWTVWFSIQSNKDPQHNNKILIREKTSLKARLERWLGKIPKEDDLKFPILLNDGTDAGLIFYPTDGMCLWLLWQEQTDMGNRDELDSRIKLFQSCIKNYRDVSSAASGIRNWSAYMTDTMEKIQPECHVAVAVTSGYSHKRSGSFSTPYHNELGYVDIECSALTKCLEGAWPLLRRPSIVECFAVRVDVVHISYQHTELHSFKRCGADSSWTAQGFCKIEVDNWNVAGQWLKSDCKNVVWNNVAFKMPFGLWQDKGVWFSANHRPEIIDFAGHKVASKLKFRDHPGILQNFPYSPAVSSMNDDIYITGGVDAMDKNKPSKRHFKVPRVGGALLDFVILEDMKTAVYGHSGCAFGNNIYFCGGFDCEGKPCTTVQIYCTRLTVRDNTQSTAARTVASEAKWVNGKSMNYAKANLGTAVLHSYLYALDQRSCERMCLFSGEWETLAYSKHILDRLPDKKDFITSCSSQDGKLVILFSCSVVRGFVYQTAYDPASGEWEDMKLLDFKDYDNGSKVVICSKVFDCQKLNPPSPEIPGHYGNFLFDQIFSELSPVS